MKILIITPHRQAVGGVEIVTEQLRQVLEKSGHDVSFLTTEAFVPSWADKIFIKILGPQFITYKAYKKMNRPPDLVIANGEFSFGIDHARLINYYHGSYSALLDSIKDTCGLVVKVRLWWRSIVQEWGIEKRNIIAVSDFLEALLRSKGAVHTRVIGNPIDMDIFTPRPMDKKFDLCFVGRHDHWGKGFDVLEKICQRGHNVLVVSDKVSTEINGMSLVQATERAQVAQILNQSKIFIFPSRFESFGQSVAEALACGVPVLMRPTGLGIKLQQHIPEFVLNNFDDIDLVENRLDWINSHYEELSRRARTYAESNFSLEVFEKQWVALVQEMSC